MKTDPRVSALAAEASRRWSNDHPTDRSRLRFFNITQQVVRGAGVGKDVFKEVLREVRSTARRDHDMIPMQR